MDLDALLVHRAQLARVTSVNDGWGGVTNATTVATVSCFLHGVDRRRLSSTGELVKLDFDLWLTPAASVAVNDSVSAVTDQDGALLLSRGRIVTVQRHSHPTLGRIATKVEITSD